MKIVHIPGGKILGPLFCICKVWKIHQTPNAHQTRPKNLLVETDKPLVSHSV